MSELDDAVNLYNEGINYYNGSNGYPFDYDLALERFKRAALANYAPAIYMTGYMIFNGFGCMQDYGKAFKLFKKAASLNCVEAYAMLGDVLYNGQGVQRNINEALKCYYYAAKEGHGDASFQAGCICMSEIKNYDKAYTFFECAIALNTRYVKEAYHNLGVISQKNKGKTPGASAALGYFEKAAKMGLVLSMVECGRIYCDFGCSNMNDQFFNIGMGYLNNAANHGSPDAAKLIKLFRTRKSGSLFDLL